MSIFPSTGDRFHDRYRLLLINLRDVLFAVPESATPSQVALFSP